MASGSSGNSSEQRRAEIEARRQRLADLVRQREERVRRSSNVQPGVPVDSSRSSSRQSENVESLISTVLLPNGKESRLGPLEIEVHTTLDIPPSGSVDDRWNRETYSKEVQVSLGEEEARRIAEEVQAVTLRREADLRKTIRAEVQQDCEGRRLKDEQNAAAAREAALQYRILEETEVNLNDPSLSDFLAKSSKVIQRAVDDRTDLLTNYASDAQSGLQQDKQRVTELLTFFDPATSKDRSITCIDWAPHFSELVLASYTKSTHSLDEARSVIQLWTTQFPSHPDQILESSSDITAAKFSPFSSNTIIAATYSGNILIYDTRRSSRSPALRTPPTGIGHSYPVYALEVIGISQAHQIASVSTDGVMCIWSLDRLDRPQETLELQYPRNLIPKSFATAALRSSSLDLAPTCLSFQHTNLSMFMMGTEDGSLLRVNRFSRADLRAGVDANFALLPHYAPLTQIAFQPNGGSRMLSCSMDWTIRMWNIKDTTAPQYIKQTTTAATSDQPNNTLDPIYEWNCDDMIYDVAWSPAHPDDIFGSVNAEGAFELWDLRDNVDEAIAKVYPGHNNPNDASALNKLAWNKDGNRVAVGGIDPRLTVFSILDD